MHISLKMFSNFSDRYPKEGFLGHMGTLLIFKACPKIHLLTLERENGREIERNTDMRDKH